MQTNRILMILTNNCIEETARTSRAIHFHSNRYFHQKMYFRTSTKVKQISCSLSLFIMCQMKLFNSQHRFKSIIYTLNFKIRLWTSINSKIMSTRIKPKLNQTFKIQTYTTNSKFRALNFKITTLDQDLWTIFKTLNKIFKIRICNRKIWISISATNSTRTNLES